MKYFVRVFFNLPKVAPEETMNCYRAAIDDVMTHAFGDVVDKCSYNIVYPTQEMIEKKRFRYEINFMVDVINSVITSKQLFEYLYPFNPNIVVQIQDARFVAAANKRYYWTNDGETTYSDGTTYVEPEYIFHANECSDYRIVHIPTYLDNHQRFNSARKELLAEHTFMWEATASSHNFMKATTIEDAIAEFENIYYADMWKAVSAT